MALTKKIDKQILEKAREVWRVVNEYDASEDFDIHGPRHGHRYIAKNIKVPWAHIDGYDLEGVMGRIGMSAEEKDSIYEEFNDQRLEGIVGHEMESSLHYVAEEMNWRYISKIDEEQRTEEQQAIYDLTIEKEDVMQTGRSGGWLTLKRKEDFEPDWNWDEGTILADSLYETLGEKGLFDPENAEEEDFNEVIEGHYYPEVTTKKKVLQELQDTLDEHEKMIIDMTTVLKWLERVKDALHENLMDRLEDDIKDYREEHLLWDRTDHE